jgi:hypothetical protein
MLWACGQPTVSDYIRNNPPYSFNTYDDYSVLKWWLNADVLLMRQYITLLVRFYMNMII